MDGMHDLGGKQGFGTIRFSPAPAGTAIYHDAWELRANALSGALVAAGLFNMDEYRHAIERMEPRHYISASYYERVLLACASLMVEKGIATKEQLEQIAGCPFALARPAAAGRPAKPAYALQIGERVTVRDEFVAGHHRMPGYIRGKTGVIVAMSPDYPFPDSAGHAMREEWEPTYDVRFDSATLWPEACDHATVTVSVFRSYLQVPC